MWKFVEQKFEIFVYILKNSNPIYTYSTNTLFL